MKENLDKLILSFFIFISPSIFFIGNNLGLGNNAELFLSLLVSVVLFIVILIVFFPLIAIKKITTYTLFIFFISLSWYFLFQISDLQIVNRLRYQLLIIVFISFFISVISYRLNILLFLKIYLILNILVIFLPKTEYLYDLLIQKNIETEYKIIYSDNRSLENISNSSNKFNLNLDENIYYIITDGLTSLKNLNEKFHLSTKEIENKISEYGYLTFEDSKSSYNMTYLTLASILSLDHIVNENSPKYKNRSNFFPRMLYKQPEKVPLISMLDRLGYEFIHIGNQWVKCDSNKMVSCNEEVKLKVIFFENYTINTFLLKNIFLNYVNLKYVNLKLSERYLVLDNDAIKKFIKSNKTKNLKKRKFYLIHHLNPHPPNLKEDCSLNDEIKNYKDWTTKGYTISSKCTLNRIAEVMKYLDEIDPTALVVIQGDHGPAINYNFDKKFKDLDKNEINERFSIFNIIKIPKSCYIKNHKNLGNVETIRIIMGCITGSENKDFFPRSYAGFYDKHDDYGKVFEVTF